MLVWGDVEWWAAALDEPSVALPRIVPPSGSLLGWAEEAAAVASAEYGRPALVEVAGIVERATIESLAEPTSPVTWSPLPAGAPPHADYAVAVAIGWATEEGSQAVVHPVTIPAPEPAGEIGVRLAEALARTAARALALQWIEI